MSDRSTPRNLAAPAVRQALAVALCCCSAWPLQAAIQADPEPLSPFERAAAFNLAEPDIVEIAVLDSMLAGERDLATGQRIGRWARRYAEAPGTTYRFGLAAGGYVERGLLVPGLVHDCISLVYRVTELARADSAHEALELALAARFAGADLDSVVDALGRVDYDHPAHLDYSLDMIRSGHWGRDVTAALPGAVTDPVGSSRYAPDSFHVLPAAALAVADLREGDLVWLVLDPRNAAARRLRQEHGLVIGHAGIVILREGVPWLVHAASRPLAPWYDRGGVVEVPLGEYLQRVERYHAVVVTRFQAPQVNDPTLTPPPDRPRR